MKPRRFFCSLLITLLLLANAAAQTDSTPAEKSKEEEQKAQQELERKALVLLNETLDGAQLLKLGENRFYIFAAAADMLWKHDEKRSRIFFAEALNELAATIKSSGPEDFRDGTMLFTFIGQRRQILTSIARRDPQFALDLLQSTRQAFSENLPSYLRMMDQELMLEQSIATEVAANDPKKALQMAQESLEKGVSYQTMNLLRKLQAKDSEAASSFVSDLIKKLGSTDFSKEREAAYVAQELLRMLIKPERNTGAATGPGNQSATRIRPLKVDEQATRDLTNIVMTAAINASSERSDFLMLQSLLPDLEKRAPERVAQLRRKLTEQNEKLDPFMKLMMQYQMLMEEGKPEALIEAALKAPPDMRNHLYNAAVSKLIQNGDLEQARRIAADNMSGDEKDRWLAQIDQQLIAKALKDGKIEEARKLIERITPKEARLARLAQMASSMFAKGDRKTALVLLDETQSLVNRPPESQQEINAMLQVARAYALIEPARAFSIIEPVLDQANSLIAAAALLEKFGADRGFFKNGEFRMQVNMSFTYSISAQYQKEIGMLARADFARTRALADRLQRDEARLMARLLIAQSVLVEKNETENAGGVVVVGGE